VRSEVILAALAVLLAAAPSEAAQIYGSLFEGGSALAGQAVRVTCDNGESDEKQTDGDGAYRLFVKTAGRCTLSLPGKGGASAEIYSFEEPVRFDFDVTKAPDGGQTLKKR